MPSATPYIHAVDCVIMRIEGPVRPIHGSRKIHTRAAKKKHPASRSILQVSDHHGAILETGILDGAVQLIDQILAHGVELKLDAGLFR
jgi:hypothetical protein